MAPLILMMLASQLGPGECSCRAIVPGDPPVILLSEQTCALRLAPVTRALETCTRAYDLVSSATTAIAALPPPVAPEAPSRASLVVGALVGAGVGAGLGVALASSESDSPIVLGGGAVIGAAVSAGIGMLIGWIAE